MSKSLSSLIVSELKEIGIKHKEKKIKALQSKCNQRIFGQALHELQLTDAFLANGTVVQVPKFVAEACSNILEQVEVEGIFRKTGSAAKQREIRKCLEAGLSLEKSHRAIDVANILSYFFRELPDALIPAYIYDTLLRCLLLDKEKRIRAIQLTCLLPAPLTYHTLAYFMQFLHTVSSYADTNKMSMENLAIVLSPSIMPYADMNNVRLRKNHIDLVKLLIQNAYLLGTVPTYINSLIKNHTKNVNEPVQTPRNYINADSHKKKKRRSEMFNGLKKIVGSIGSSENLDCSVEDHSKADSKDSKQRQKNVLYKKAVPFTPTSSHHRRTFMDPVSVFTVKKKMENPVPSFNINGRSMAKVKEKKQSRMSLGGNRILKNSAEAPTHNPTIERRWSLVSSGWSKSKKKSLGQILDKSPRESQNQVFELPTEHTKEIPFIKAATTTDSDSDQICISKSEYEAIKQRVTAIEKQISEEFDDVQSKVLEFASIHDDPYLFRPVDFVKSNYNKVKIETEDLTGVDTDQLAKRLGRALKIRRTASQAVIRSPSARKIGTLRKRSNERNKVTRTKTWHISDTSMRRPQQIRTNEMTYSPLFSNASCDLINSKTDLIAPRSRQSIARQDEFEDWTPAETFFRTDQPPSELENKFISKLVGPQVVHYPCTPNKEVKPTADNFQTPMLPPKSAPRKYTASCTPSTVSKMNTTGKVSHISHLIGFTPDEETGRASIARLRTQNAGMVLAKAKLFDDLSDKPSSVSRDNLKENNNTCNSIQKFYTPKPAVPVKPKFIKFEPDQSASPKRNNYKRPVAQKKPQPTQVKPKNILDEVIQETVVVPVVPKPKYGGRLAHISRESSNNQIIRNERTEIPKISSNSVKKFNVIGNQIDRKKTFQSNITKITLK